MATCFLNPTASCLRLVSSSASSTSSSSSSSSFAWNRLRLGRPPPPGARRRAELLRVRLLASGRLCVRCGAVRTIGESEFSAEVVGSELPVLVEFVADWCGPCRLISPVIDWASQEYNGKLNVVKIDHDANPRLIEEYKVYGLPTLILFKNGQEVPESRREGAITKVKLKEYLDSLLGSTTVV